MRLKKLLLLLPLAAAACGGKKLAPFDMESRRLGVVMNFQYKASDKAYVDAPNAFADQLSRALFDTERLRVIDRQRLRAALDELKLPSDKPLDSAQIGIVAKQLKAEVAVYGDVLSVLKDSEEKKDRVTERMELTVDAKLVLSSTAEILSHGQATGMAVIRYKKNSPPPAEILLNAALADAAKQVATQLVTGLQPK